MLHSHPRDACCVQSNFKETYLGLVGPGIGVSWSGGIGVSCLHIRGAIPCDVMLRSAKELCININVHVVGGGGGGVN